MFQDFQVPDFEEASEPGDPEDAETRAASMSWDRKDRGTVADSGRGRRTDKGVTKGFCSSGCHLNSPVFDSRAQCDG